MAPPQVASIRGIEQPWCGDYYKPPERDFVADLRQVADGTMQPTPKYVRYYIPAAPEDPDDYELMADSLKTPLGKKFLTPDLNRKAVCQKVEPPKYSFVDDFKLELEKASRNIARLKALPEPEKTRQTKLAWGIDKTDDHPSKQSFARICMGLEVYNDLPSTSYFPLVEGACSDFKRAILNPPNPVFTATQALLNK